MYRKLVAAALIIVGVFVFVFTMPMLGFWGSLIVWILFAGVSYVITASGEQESRLKNMEERIRKLEEDKVREPQVTQEKQTAQV